jgi:hypothetical protein
MIKKILGLTFLLSISWTLSFAYQGQLPEIYISQVKTDKAIYNAGDTIKGTFLIRNYDAVVAPSVYYEVRLTGDYKDTIAQTGYSHTDMNGPLTLGAKESRTISFKYKLPNTLSGKNLGIQVQAMLENGLGMGWGDAFFDVSGFSSFVNIEDAYITKSSTSTEYALQQGPMVYQGDKVYINIEFNNLNTTQLIYPKLTIYDRSEARNTLLTKDEPVISAGAKSITKSKIELPTFDYVPKVYVGKLEFLNKAGEQISNTLDFRYIVFGQMITINNVISDKEYANKGDTVAVAVNITGSPFDIDNQNISASSIGQTEIKLFNENNILVGENLDKNVDFNKGEVKTYDIKITNKAKTLRAEIKVLNDQGSKTLGEMKVNLTKNPMPETNILTSLVQYILVAILVLLILLSIWFAVKRKNKLAIILLGVVVIIILGWVIAVKTEKARAWVYIQSYLGNATYSNLATFFVNYPTPDQEFNPSESITVQAYASMVVCGNQPIWNAFGVYNDNDTGTYSAQSQWTVQVRNSMTAYYYSLPFVLASIPGAHNLMGYFYVSNATSGTGLGYQPYIIRGACTDGIKNGTETGIDCGGSCPNACVVAPTCTDGIQNGTETGIDCGGSCVNVCAVTPTCTDGIKNGTEAGIDCGGSCVNTCSDGGDSGDGSDSGGSGSGTCTDGIKNGTETGIDCGGSCSACIISGTGSTGTCTITSPSGSNAVLNHTTTWSVNSSCTAPCQYIWTGSDLPTAGRSTGESNTLSKIYTTIGMKNISVQVLNSDGSSYCSNPESVITTTTVSMGTSTSNER